ncbi:hypothetical protein CEXT_688921 [Caerostris extrusa]|uniref:Uncharacterized protein n=1 Tax=Caerostris extrusa TaxID=172846 RepID=A0AAV4P5S2_CAEEX|nr:hypothetical protein CEXT_688921 [Caerostris extrusa]
MNKNVRQSVNVSIKLINSSAKTNETLSPVLALSSAVMAIFGIPLVKTYTFVNFHAFSSKAEGRFAKNTSNKRLKFIALKHETLELTKVNKDDG